MPKTPPTNGQRKLRYIELFAGIGGFGLALNRLGHTCVYVNEWDKYASDTYEKNFGHKPDTRDLTTVPVSDIPDHDLLVGGFPCQAFSIAGKRAGFNDTRGTLFFDIARIIKKKRTKYLLLENVKGLLSHDSGRTFKTILSTLTELGYDIQTMVLNSKNFGVPQNRERVFIVGHLRGEPRPKVFPFRKSDEVHTRPDTTKEEVHAGTLTARQFANWNGNYIRQVNQPTHSNNRVYADDGISPTLNTMGGGRRQPKVMIGDYRYDEGLRIRKNNISPTIRQEMKGQDVSKSALLISEMKIRRLTPLECERLQGFPDNWTEGVSDTQRYKQLGNAVTVNVVEEIAKRLIL